MWWSLSSAFGPSYPEGAAVSSVCAALRSHCVVSTPRFCVAALLHAVILTCPEDTARFSLTEDGIVMPGCQNIHRGLRPGGVLSGEPGEVGQRVS